MRDGMIQANQDRVLFFHFHALKRLPSGEYLASHGAYKAPLTPDMRDYLYRPYLRELSLIEREVAVRFASPACDTVREPGSASPPSRWWRGWRSRLKDALDKAMDRRRGYVISPD